MSTNSRTIFADATTKSRQPQSGHKHDRLNWTADESRHACSDLWGVFLGFNTSSCVSEHVQHMYSLANRSYGRTTLKALDVPGGSTISYLPIAETEALSIAPLLECCSAYIDTLDTIAAEEYEG